MATSDSKVLTSGCMQPMLAVARQSVRLMRADVVTLATMLVMPVILMTFFLPMARQALQASGYRGANGSEQVVPGMTVGFGLFMLGYVAFGFISEHGWGTWERLRASRASPRAVVIGKLVPAVGMTIVYEIILFVVGVSAFGLRPNGLVLALILTGVAFAVCLVSIGIFVAAIARSPQQVNAISNLCGLGLGALGGAYVPRTLLPNWAQEIAPLTPTYWAIEGFRAGLLPGQSLASALVGVAVLLAIALGFGMAASRTFRFEETRTAANG